MTRYGPRKSGKGARAESGVRGGGGERKKNNAKEEGVLAQRAECQMGAHGTVRQ